MNVHASIPKDDKLWHIDAYADDPSVETPT